MSHISAGFTITDIETLRQVVDATCPTMTLVEQNTYRCWVTDHGGLAGDYPLPAAYQIRLLLKLQAAGVDIYAIQQECKVTPRSLQELESNPWSLAEQRKIQATEKGQQAYNQLVSEVGQDATYAIVKKPGSASDQEQDPRLTEMYEIGLVEHPLHKGQYDMVADFFVQGYGLMQQPGIGLAAKDANGQDVWGGELKQAYAVAAAEKEIQRMTRFSDFELTNVRKTVLEDGTIKIELTA